MRSHRYSDGLIPFHSRGIYPSYSDNYQTFSMEPLSLEIYSDSKSEQMAVERLPPIQAQEVVSE
jgi:hypothetical protein